MTASAIRPGTKKTAVLIVWPSWTKVLLPPPTLTNATSRTTGQCEGRETGLLVAAEATQVEAGLVGDEPDGIEASAAGVIRLLRRLEVSPEVVAKG